MTAANETVAFLDVGAGAEARRIAYLKSAGNDALPGVMWFSGFHSEMTSTKAAAVAAGPRAGPSCLRFDYSGHGAVRRAGSRTAR